MTGWRLGRLSLGVDAWYCVTLGVIVAVAAPLISPWIALPTPLMVVAGAAVVLWAGLVAWMRATVDLRTTLRIVLIVNVIAAGLIASVSLLAASVLAVLITLAVAVDVGLFAGSQALALARLRRLR